MGPHAFQYAQLLAFWIDIHEACPDQYPLDGVDLRRRVLHRDACFFFSFSTLFAAARDYCRSSIYNDDTRAEQTN